MWRAQTFGSPGLALSRYSSSSSICKGMACRQPMSIMPDEQCLQGLMQVEISQQKWCSVYEASGTSFWPTKFCELCAMMMPPSASMNCFSFASASGEKMFEIGNDTIYVTRLSCRYRVRMFWSTL